MARNTSDVFTDRPPWASAPANLRNRVHAALASPEVTCLDVHGGMTPGPAAALTLGDGRTVFVKAAAASASQDLYRAEAAALALLPASLPAARLIATVESDGWFALITSFVPGAVAGSPWTDAGIRAVDDACMQIASYDAPVGVPPILGLLPDLDGWAHLVGAPGLDRWEADRVERLAEAVVGWREWTAGRALVHHDLRGDNAIVDEKTGTAVLVDWSYCSAGAPWIDRAMLAADIVAAGHADGAAHAVAMSLAIIAALPPEAASFVVGLAGMWRFNSTLPPHANMPTHRGWQRDRALKLRPLIDAITPDTPPVAVGHQPSATPQTQYPPRGGSGGMGRMSNALTGGQLAALAHVRRVAREGHGKALARLGDVNGIDEICAVIRDHGRITLNFHPDRLLADGRTVAAALAGDGRYRSQFETQISNGGRTAYPGGDRDMWERSLFGAAYHDGTAIPADRPKYGALNLLNHADGGAPRFGSCHLRLRPSANAWTTFTFGDSHLGPVDIGTADAFTPVLAALFEGARASGTALGVPVDDLEGYLRALATAPVGASPSMAPSRSLDDYVEAQVHGPVDLFEHAEAFVLDPSFRDTEAGQLIQGAAASAGVGIEWHCGFELSAAEVPEEFRGPELSPFARFVSERFGTGGRLDAAIVGEAAASIVRAPASWNTWGTQDEALQLVKRLWHILAAFGSAPAR